MEDRPNDIQEGETAWCSEFGLVQVMEIHPPDEMYDWWIVTVEKEGPGTEETTDLKNLQSEIPITRWSWEDSDEGSIFIYGYDPQDRHVVTRSFRHRATVQQGPTSTRPFIDEDHGSWSDNIPAVNLSDNE